MRTSCVLPSHNCAPYLPHAIDSIIKQVDEVIIVNDGSKDSTNDYLVWLLEHSDTVKVINLNGDGVSKARNAGNMAATGDIIFVLDADDIASPDRVKKTLAKFKDGVEYVYGGAEIMDYAGKKIRTHVPDVFNLRNAISNKVNEIVHSTVAYTKKLAIECPYLEVDEISRNGLDDWWHQLDCISRGRKFDFVPSSICGYRILGSGLSSKRKREDVDAIKQKYFDALKAVA